MAIRSFALDLENSSLIRGAEFVLELCNVEDTCRAESGALALDE